MKMELGLMEDTMKKEGRGFNSVLQDDAREAKYLLTNLVGSLIGCPIAWDHKCPGRSKNFGCIFLKSIEYI